MIFADAFLEEIMPIHMNTHTFFADLHRILHDDGCLITNANLPTTITFDKLVQTLSSTFESNISFMHTNTVENARVIFSGRHSSLSSIDSKEHAIRQAKQLEIDAQLEFDLAHLISLAYQGSIKNTAMKTFYS